MRKSFTIEAAVLRRGGRFVIESVTMEPPREAELLVRIAAAGICREHLERRASPGRQGRAAVLVHEGAGVVVAAGGRVRRIKPGDHVVLSYQSCGRCEACRRGQPARCADFGRLNSELALRGVRRHLTGPASFAAYSIATERNAVPVSEALPLEILAPLGGTLQTGAGLVMNTLRVKKGRSLAVFGAGSIGLAAVMAGRVVGAYPIIAIDLQAARLEAARVLGASHLINNSRQDVSPAVRRAARGGVDYVIELTGDPAMEETALAVLAPAGAAAWLRAGALGCRADGGRTYIEVTQGDADPRRFIPKLIRLYQRGLFPFERILSFYDFKDINRAAAAVKRGDAIKAVLCMERRAQPQGVDGVRLVLPAGWR